MNIQDIKQKLESELALVESELKSVGRKNPSNANDWEAKPSKMDIQAADSNEVADRFESYEENMAILQELETRFNSIKQALDRIEKGTYGLCTVCSKKIEEGRLEANPAATTCMDHL